MKILVLWELAWWVPVFWGMWVHSPPHTPKYGPYHGNSWRPKILVTGGTGYVGKVVGAQLVKNGHEVRVADLKPVESPVAGAAYMQCDVTVYDQVRETVRGMEGIAHLAAYPNPSLAPGPSQPFTGGVKGL